MLTLVVRQITRVHTYIPTFYNMLAEFGLIIITITANQTSPKLGMPFFALNLKHDYMTFQIQR